MNDNEETRIEIRKSSSAFTWTPLAGGEVFCSIAGNFDINEAKRILAKKPRKVVEELPIAEVKDMLHPRKGLYALRVAVDWDRVDNDKTIDLTIPVIVADLGRTFLVIDGWHRIAVAAEQSLPTLPMVLLSKAETKKVRS